MVRSLASKIMLSWREWIKIENIRGRNSSLNDPKNHLEMSTNCLFCDCGKRSRKERRNFDETCKMEGLIA